MLPKKYRLTTRGDFKGTFVGSLRSRSGPFQLVCRKTTLPHSRFGFVVSRAVSKKATQRNFLRRRLHDIIQKFLPALPIRHDFVIRAYPEAINLRFEIIEQHIEDAFHKIGFIK